MKYLLQAIESSRHRVDLSDADLTKLLTDVQKSRDDRTLLHDSLERLLHDLRAQSHAQAFLARVNKRDAPDYYDVIRNPMDLGLMLKNVKSGKYRSKEAFRKDLDLIWDNCLLYNNEPTHPLRLSANLMRKRSHDLLSYIQDSHDVKSALSEWVATHTSLTPAEAKALQRGDVAAVAGITHSTSSSYLGAVAAATASSTPRAQAAGPSLPSPLAGAKDPNVPRPSPLPLVEEKPFEEQFAFTIGSAASLGLAELEQRRRDERSRVALRHLLGRDWSPAYTSEVSRGKRREMVAVQQPLSETDDDNAEVEGIVRSLAEGNALEAAMSFCGVGGPSSVPACTQPAHNVGYAAMPRLPQSSLVEPESTTLNLAKRRHNRQASVRRTQRDRPNLQEIHAIGEPSSLKVCSPPPEAKREPRERRRAVDCMKRNIKTHGRMHRLKRKFDHLDYCLDNDEPLPSSLLVDSDDEGGHGPDDERIKAGKGARSSTAPWNADAIPSSRSVHPDVFGRPVSSQDESSSGVSAHPFPHLCISAARSALQARVSLLCGNAGFSSSHSRPLDILTSVLEEFLCSIGRTLRIYIDRYASTTMSAEEILLHTLHAASSVGPKEIEKYLFEDTVRYSNRLEDLKRKMEYSWKERIALGEERLVSEEDARFFGAEGSEDLMVGNIPSALDDDFFGFKALGLDRELGMNNLTVPARLFRGRGGMVGRRAGEAAGTGKDREGEKEAFPAPPPFIRLSERAVPAQIGLLQSFYRDLLHRRGHRARDKTQERDRDRRGSADVGDDADEEEEEAAEEVDEDMVVVSDDEWERTGATGGTGTRGGGGGGSGGQGASLKIGQAGIMPKREFWVDPVILARSTTTRAKGTNAAGGASQMVPTPSASASGATSAAAAAAAAATSAGKGSGGGAAGRKSGAGGASTGKKGKGKKDR